MTITTQRRGKRFAELVADAKETIQQIDAATLRQWQADPDKAVTIIDVREQNDTAQGMIDGATAIGRGVLELSIDDAVPNQDDTVVLYCGGGSRSALAAQTLEAMGYTNVYSLAGGWRGWNQ